MSTPVELEDRMPSELLDPGEKEDIITALEFRLGFCLHDEEDGAVTEAEWAEIVNEYNRMGRLYYVFTGRDFLCGHGFISNYGRRE